MATLKTSVKKLPTDKLIGFRAGPQERAIIKAKADEFTKGNVSEWLRYSATNMVPKKEDTV